MPETGYGIIRLQTYKKTVHTTGKRGATGIQ